MDRPKTVCHKPFNSEATKNSENLIYLQCPYDGYKQGRGRAAL